MKTIPIPYYTGTLDLHVAEENLKAVVTAKMHHYKAEKGEVELVKEALENPIGSPRLSEIAKGKKTVTLVTSDHTRAVPSKITLPILLAEIRKGNPEAEITILIATGLHRATTRKTSGSAVRRILAKTGPETPPIPPNTTPAKRSLDMVVEKVLGVI